MRKAIFVLVLVLVALPFGVFAQEQTSEAILLPLEDLAAGEVDIMEVTTELPEVDPLSLDSADIILNGSSTVGPLSIAVGEAFTLDGFPGTVDVTITGSGTGIGIFCEERTLDIANASRAMRRVSDEGLSELELCIEENADLPIASVPPVEFQVGVDALTVVVNPENTFATALSTGQLAQIFTGEVATWGEVYPDLEGEDAAAAIELFTPGDESGTFDYFIEVIAEELEMEEDEVAGMALSLQGDSLQTSANDNVIAEGVESSKYAIGYFGFAYFVSQQDRVNAVAIDAGDGPVEPTEENATAGLYPISRPLFIYSSPVIMQERPATAAFINYYLSNVADILANAPEDADYRYFPASPAAQELSRQNWMMAMGMMEEME